MRDRRDVPPRYLDGVSRYHPHRYQTPPTSQHTDIAIPPPPISRYRDATPYHPHRYRDIAMPPHTPPTDIAMPFHTTPTDIAISRCHSIPPPPISRYHPHRYCDTTIPPYHQGYMDCMTFVWLRGNQRFPPRFGFGLVARLWGRPCSK